MVLLRSSQQPSKSSKHGQPLSKALSTSSRARLRFKKEKQPGRINSAASLPHRVPKAPPQGLEDLIQYLDCDFDLRKAHVTGCGWMGKELSSPARIWTLDELIDVEGDDEPFELVKWNGK